MDFEDFINVVDDGTQIMKKNLSKASDLITTFKSVP